ncbi:MAG: IPExxxVDY family protein [Bacteroidetes bacterium]|nr:IPExxxVDY family protein [Bacteroidota bacterium]MBS1629184.1 IPExxxVDY family protein [Bacteroidota bacterium]
MKSYYALVKRSTMARKQVLDNELLFEDYFSDAALIGITSHEPVYKLCGTLNQYFDTRFVCRPEHEIHMQDKRSQKDHYFCVYQHKAPFNGPKHVLYELKCDKMSLLPEAKGLDFLWMIHSSSSDCQAQLYLDYLRRIPIIQLATLIGTDQLRNLGNLII